jgi:hypothetical protein
MDVDTGSRKLLGRAPVLNASFATDREGRVRFAWGADTDTRTKLYYREDDGAKWELVNDEHESGISMFPRGFNADGSKAYIQSEEKQGPIRSICGT